MKIVFVRYGQYKDGHLDEIGKHQMVFVSEKIKNLLAGQNFCVVCADIPRAVESAKVIANNLGAKDVQSFKEFYSAKEDGIEVDVARAKNIFDSLKYDFVVAVISREYIEVFANKNLERGEFYILDYNK